VLWIRIRSDRRHFGISGAGSGLMPIHDADHDTAVPPYR
jgi:hypothetical protein